jgi:hypothetical protein
MFDVQLGYVGLCGGILCVGLCMWIVDMAMYQFRIWEIVYNLGLGGLLAKRCFFGGSPCIGHI